MSTWARPPGAARRTAANQNGSFQPRRVFRRAAPYPPREERSGDSRGALDSCDGQTLAARVKDDVSSARPEDTQAARRETLYQKFYRQVQDDQKTLRSDCVVLSVTNKSLDFPKSLSRCLRGRGLSVEMLYLQAESGLTRALQDVQAAGSPVCVLVEQTNVALCSCTIIVFSDSLRIHRNMPKDQALDFVESECKHRRVKASPDSDPADVAAQASQLLVDFMDREKIERHVVPSDTRQLLLLLAQGVHVYPEELETLSEYVQSRQDHLRGSQGEVEKLLPPTLGKPPPLLPTPPGPPQLQPAAAAPAPLLDLPRPGAPLLPTPGSFLHSKPPPLLSLHRAPRPPRSLLGAPRLLQGPLLHHMPQYHGPRGPGGPRGSPPSLSSRLPLLATPAGLLPPPAGPRLC